MAADQQARNTVNSSCRRRGQLLRGRGVPTKCSALVCHRRSIRHTASFARFTRRSVCFGAPLARDAAAVVFSAQHRVQGRRSKRRSPNRNIRQPYIGWATGANDDQIQALGGGPVTFGWKATRGGVASSDPCSWPGRPGSLSKEAIAVQIWQLSSTNRSEECGGSSDAA